MTGIGLPEVVIVFAIVAACLVRGWPAGRICRRLGFSQWLGLLAVVPLGEVLLLWFVALARWPTDQTSAR
jgi:hypothetical protein